MIVLICFIDFVSVNYILSVLNSFDVNTKFAYKLKIKVNYDSYIQLCVEQERRFIQQFNEKIPAMMYI